MTRRALFGAILPAIAQEPKPTKKWYITGGHRVDPKQNDCNVSPLVSYGEDRFDAISRSGITVWSEEEWAEAQGSFRKFCEEQGK